MSLIKVLDHGFVKLLNVSGPTRRKENDFDAVDIDPANSARMSFNQRDSGRTEAEDLKLIRYLIKNRHNTPIEMVECWFEMKLPIFVARQFVRHRTATINEVSGRYIKLPEEWYIPEVVGKRSKTAKQGQDDNLSLDIQQLYKIRLDQICKESYDAYLLSLNQGVAPEHARLLLHLNHYTHWLWKQDLHNLLHFLSLRDHSHAQVEAQAYAKAMDSLLRPVLPNIMEYYETNRMN